MSKTTLTHRASHNIFSSIERLFKGIANAIKAFFMAIINGILSIIKGVIWIFTSVIKGIVWTVKTTLNGIVSFFKWLNHVMWLVFVRPFLPTHRVVFSLYTVIPGLPVNRNETIHAFEKGTTKKALKFYDDVVRSATEKRIVPAEVRLYKRRRMVASRHFGPVDEIRKFKVVNKRVKV